MSKKRPLILITNDDGIQAKGIRSLIEAVEPFGDIVIVAPDKPQSGMGHAITVNDVLRLDPSPLYEQYDAYTCTGTPVDCVKLAIAEVIKGKPDLLVSGINHGENSASNVLYSGTMSAAVEGAMEDIPSIGFSLLDFDADADFSASQWAVKEVVKRALNGDFPKSICLNVNIPQLKTEEIKGIRVCRQAKAYWKDSFDKRYDQFGKPYFWLKGEFNRDDWREDTDIWALDNGYVSVVPTQFDMTAYHTISEIAEWEF
ncbi:5'/3'-nucleotidase SurE [Brumimicrobium oceani]|uniref:5'-nucleotidase SurE n=1 Tax=Brumimicrobium oceani TaxID=2100725 RepID=A0A2U2X289_9FLAO|nr:5'/3'-nucleotidase SurE [Brumimicrobium oceani]PWH81887.1 5'/3'-nucleotidase SurE [Brumimicrobium oceani]